MLEAQYENRNAGTGLLRLKGALTIENAGELRQELLARLERNDILEINLEALDGIDIYGIQALCSAHRTALAGNKTLGLNGGRPAVLDQAILLSGFFRYYGCSYSCSNTLLCLFANPEANGERQEVAGK